MKGGEENERQLFQRLFAGPSMNICICQSEKVGLCFCQNVIKGFQREPYSISSAKPLIALEFDKRLHAHLFRHTAATHLNKAAGTDITQHVLGHSQRHNTEKYTHLNPDLYAVYMKRHPLLYKILSHESVFKLINQVVVF